MDRQRSNRVAVSAIASAAFVVHRIWPTQLELNNTDLALLVVAVLPWLTYLVKAVELPGGLKVELQEIREEAERARGEASSASQQAASALGVATESATQQPLTRPESDHAVLKELIARYDQIRSTQEKSYARTQAMTDVVNRMMLTAPRVPEFDIGGALTASTDERGRRLAAFARLWIMPDAAYLPQLVEGITDREDKPFGQFWGIMALKKVLSAAGPRSLTTPLFRKLQLYLERIPQDTDRFAELAPLLRESRRSQNSD